jgi:hypothetical protein
MLADEGLQRGLVFLEKCLVVVLYSDTTGNRLTEHVRNSQGGDLECRDQDQIAGPTSWRRS